MTTTRAEEIPFHIAINNVLTAVFNHNDFKRDLVYIRLTYDLLYMSPLSDRHVLRAIREYTTQRLKTAAIRIFQNNQDTLSSYLQQLSEIDSEILIRQIHRKLEDVITDYLKKISDQTNHPHYPWHKHATTRPQHHTDKFISTSMTIIREFYRQSWHGNESGVSVFDELRQNHFNYLTEIPNEQIQEHFNTIWDQYRQAQFPLKEEQTFRTKLCIALFAAFSLFLAYAESVRESDEKHFYENPIDILLLLGMVTVLAANNIGNVTDFLERKKRFFEKLQNHLMTKIMEQWQGYTISTFNAVLLSLRQSWAEMTYVPLEVDLSLPATTAVECKPAPTPSEPIVLTPIIRVRPTPRLRLSNTSGTLYARPVVDEPEFTFMINGKPTSISRDRDYLRSIEGNDDPSCIDLTKLHPVTFLDRNDRYFVCVHPTIIDVLSTLKDVYQWMQKSFLDGMHISDDSLCNLHNDCFKVMFYGTGKGKERFAGCVYNDDHRNGHVIVINARLTVIDPNHLLSNPAVAAITCNQYDEDMKPKLQYASTY